MSWTLLGNMLSFTVILPFLSSQSHNEGNYLAHVTAAPVRGAHQFIYQT